MSTEITNNIDLTPRLHECFEGTGSFGLGGGILVAQVFIPSIENGILITEIYGQPIPNGNYLAFYEHPEGIAGPFEVSKERLERMANADPKSIPLHLVLGRDVADSYTLLDERGIKREYILGMDRDYTWVAAKRILENRRRVAT